MESVIIADDMTGSNVSNSLLAKDGFKVGTISDIDELENYKNYDALGIHTDSRGLIKSEAYNTVKINMEKLKNTNPTFFTKRIDSTLRGNNGAELDAMLDVLGGDSIAVVVPSFPDSGKIVIGNYMLVDGIPLEMTDVKNDPTSPISTSRVINIFKEQSEREVGVISMETILEGKEAIKDTMIALKDNGSEIILIDACTNEDIETIANATLESKLNFVAVDPGPFTYYLVKNSKENTVSKNKQKLLFVIGSVSTVAISQISRFRAEFNPYIVHINARALLYDNQSEKEKKRVENQVLNNLDENEMFLIATMVDREDKLDLGIEAEKAGLTKYQASTIISENTADIGNKISKRMGSSLGGVYTSGGDITQSFLKSTGTTGIQIKDEIIPLAVYGTIMGGKLSGKSIVTKGGLIGDEYTLTECAEYLQTKIANDKYEIDEEEQVSVF